MTIEFLTGPQWNRIGIDHHHGMALPITALHSSTSAGCGDFQTLREFLQVVETAHFDTLQLLPLNDTGHDSSPYMGLSGYALNPLYLSLPSLPHFFEKKERRDEWSTMQKEAKPSLPHFDFTAIRQRKWNLLTGYLDQYQQLFESDTSFHQFCDIHAYWLESNAAFRALKEYYNHIAWWDWREEHHCFPCLLPAESFSFVQRWKVIQYLCYEQLREVKKEAEKRGVFLMGDLPILLNKDSSDVWAERALFDTTLEVGAPPDMYSKEGQRWGFPLYKWKVHQNDSLRWWKGRLAYAEQFYHLYRLDHIVGFYRLFAMRPNASSKKGRFIPCLPQTCLKQGERILEELVLSTDMLPIGEDLGSIPDYVRESMNKLAIPGTKVMRWERFWHVQEHPFIPLHQYNPESVTTVSTHDSSSLQGWAKEDPLAFEEALQAWNISPSRPKKWEIFLDVLKASHETSSLFHINLLEEYLCLLTNRGWTGESQNRINVPGTVSPLNWTFQFRPSVEAMLEDKELQSVLHYCKSSHQSV